jgi:hypothetical protein
MTVLGSGRFADGGCSKLTPDTGQAALFWAVLQGASIKPASFSATLWWCDFPLEIVYERLLHCLVTIASVTHPIPSRTRP